jgi:phospholipid transport system substrate-binding protein
MDLPIAKEINNERVSALAKQQMTKRRGTLLRKGVDMRVYLMAFAFAIAALGACPVHSAPAEPSDAVRQFVEQVNRTSMTFFESGSDDDARDRTRSLLASSFDVPAMAEFALGKAWGSTSEEDRKAYLRTFESQAVSEYLRRMKDGARIEFVGMRAPDHGDLLAANKVSTPGKEEQTWIWKLRPTGDSWKIVDVLIDGKSAMLEERDTYAEVLKANHGDINALITYIRSRTDS